MVWVGAQRRTRLGARGRAVAAAGGQPAERAPGPAAPGAAVSQGVQADGQMEAMEAAQYQIDVGLSLPTHLPCGLQWSHLL